MMQWLHPWWLMLLLPWASMPIFSWFKKGATGQTHPKSSTHWLNWHATPALPYPSLAAFEPLASTWRVRFAWIPGALTWLAIGLSIVAMARPRTGKTQAVVTTEGIAIEMIVDRSTSMLALDFQLDGERVDRLTAVKDVATRFIRGETDSGLLAKLQSNGRESDRIGLVQFAGYADALVPPTLDHDYLIAHLKRIDFAFMQSESGTAIGDALALAVEKLQSVSVEGDSQASVGESVIKSRVVILLTDGENNAGETDPLTAAELAAAIDVKVYTIGVGTRGVAPFPVSRSSSGRVNVRSVEVSIDEETLQQIAGITGGKYFRATDTDSLVSIYEEIDSLERTTLRSENFTDYREWAVSSIVLAGWSLPPLLLIVLGTICLALTLRCTAFRSITAA